MIKEWNSQLITPLRLHHLTLYNLYRTNMVYEQ